MNGRNGVPQPLEPLAIRAPDRDFESARKTAIDVVTELAGAEWTDHNEPDPGITLLEVLVWGVADLHYRTGERHLSDWPLEVPSWLPSAEHHWSGVPFPADPGTLLSLAALAAQPGAGGGTVADDMADVVAGATSAAEAAGALIDQDFGGRRLSGEEATAVVRMLRLPQLLRTAQDRSDRVDDALERKRGDPDETFDELRRDPVFDAVGDEELRAIVRRQIRRRLAARVAVRADAIRSLADDAAATAALLVSLTSGDDPLAAEQAEQALALNPCPPGILAEFWEAVDGATEVWPPHPLQARTCEPVTADDYAHRARTATGVRRAWAVPGVLDGIGWDGHPAAADPRPGAVTLLVEPDPPVAPADEADFLRDVLRTSVGGPTGAAEVDDPYTTWRDSLDDETPRRLLGDEVGAALVRSCEVRLKATLHAPPGSDRTSVIERTLERVAEHFRSGRPESRPPEPGPIVCPEEMEGPWPRVPQPVLGWNPGEAIRVNELVQIVAAVEEVLGVEGLQLSLEGGDWLPLPGTAAEVPLPAQCVPVLAERQCLQVRLALASECARG